MTHLSQSTNVFLHRGFDVDFTVITEDTIVLKIRDKKYSGSGLTLFFDIEHEHTVRRIAGLLRTIKPRKEDSTDGQ